MDYVDPSSPNLARIYFSGDHGYTRTLFQSLDIAAFSNAVGSQLSDVENDPKFYTFDPPPCENKGERWTTHYNSYHVVLPLISVTYDCLSN